MSRDAPPERAERSRLAAVLDRIPTLVWIGAAALVVVGVVALLGGLDDADASAAPEPLEPLSVGVASGGAPTDIAVLSATRTTAVPELWLEAEPGTELLVVEVEAENIWDRTTVGLRRTALLLVGGEHVEAERALVSADLAAVTTLPPRVPTRVTLIWTVPTGAIGDDASVVLTDSVFVPDPVLLDAPYWRDTGPRWIVTVPVADAPHAADDGDEG